MSRLGMLGALGGLTGFGSAPQQQPRKPTVIPYTGKPLGGLTQGIGTPGWNAPPASTTSRTWNTDPFGYHARLGRERAARKAAARARQPSRNIGAATGGLRGGYSVTTPLGPSPEVVSGLQGLVSSYNQAYAQAKAANEARYQQMLGIASQTTGQRAADIRGSYAQQEAGMMQGLARRGMAGTTIAPTMKMGIARERESSLNRLADLMQQTKLGIIERREDKYPDLSSLQAIIAGTGAQYGGGMGLPATLQAFGGIRT